MALGKVRDAHRDIQLHSPETEYELHREDVGIRSSALGRWVQCLLIDLVPSLLQISVLCHGCDEPRLLFILAKFWTYEVHDFRTYQ